MDFIWHIIALIGTFIPYTLGYNLIFGKGKILHFGPLGISIPTVYTIALILIHTQNFLLAFIAGLAMALLFSALFAWVSLRLDADAFGVMSIALHLSTLAVVLNWNSLTRGALGIPRIPRLPFLNSVFDFAVFGIVISVFSVIAVWHIDRSSFGRKLSALAEHEWHAKSLGINKSTSHLLAFLIGGVGIAFGNFIHPQYLTLLHPNDFLFPNFIFVVMIVVAGRPGSVLGVTLSTILLLVLREALRFVPLAPAVLGPVRLMLFGIILFGAVWWRRDTLFPQERQV
tara:strand:- start:58 stop:912 length:855 start_codon:yes stop_codon:yes gene_type:complete